MSSEVSPIANIASSIPVTSAYEPIKVAIPELIMIASDEVPIETMTDMVFGDIGGHEIISVSRNDLVNGANISYQMVKDLQEMAIEYNPKNIIALPESSETYFNNFTIKLDKHIPAVGNGVDGQNVYFDELTGDLIIEVVNMTPGDNIEVEFITSTSLFGDTIYEIGIL
jgi:hypothetical protein